MTTPDIVERLRVELPNPWRPVMLSSQRVRIGHGQMDGAEVLHIVDAFERLRLVARDARTVIEEQAATIDRLRAAVGKEAGGYILPRAWHDPSVGLVSALDKIAKMKPEPIMDSGFQHGPQLLLDNCQRTAREALRSYRKAVSPPDQPPGEEP